MEVTLTRREFLHLLGAGLLITVGSGAVAQRGGGPSSSMPIAMRVHIGEDGSVTVMTGKVELGQGARTELTQAAAEELKLPMEAIRLVMGDTDLVPDDGVTAGSRTTPATVPAVRQGAAAAREVLAELAAQQWQVDVASVSISNGVISHEPSQRRMTYAELAAKAQLAEALKRPIPRNVQLTPVEKWEVLGVSKQRPNARDLVTGAHRFASDIVRPNMLYGKVLRPPSFGAKLTAIDVSRAHIIPDVQVVRDGDFVGCVAPTSFAAGRAIQALAESASWETAPQPSNADLWNYLRQHAAPDEGLDPALQQALASAAKTLQAEYHTAYIQHAPMEPGSAVAEWADGRLTVWVGTRGPFQVRSRLAEVFGLSPEQVRVITPDTGGGFGMKSGDLAAVEAARLAKAVGRPVRIQWTRQEEFTWAYFRPAALIEIRAGLDANGKIVAWDFTNINSGGAAIDTPYTVPHVKCRYRASQSPLQQSSYRALAATANNFARECFMDELASAAEADPLAFRLSHLQDERLRTVLQTAAERFGWTGSKPSGETPVGFGLACGREKASYVAACAEVSVDQDRRTFTVRRVCEVFECGTILNPANLRSQVYGCMIMGLGAVIGEEIRFADGKILNPSFTQYPVPRFQDVPELDIHLLNRTDIEPAGGGETPLIAIAPAIANAIFDAIGVRVRDLPIKL